jgi:type I restriction enzyme, R subunit
MTLTESDLEEHALELLQAQGFGYVHGAQIAPDGEQPERSSLQEVILTERLRSALARINPSVPADAREEALKQVFRLPSPDVTAANEAFHTLLLEGIKIPYHEAGLERAHLVWLIDFEQTERNDFLAVNQFTIAENHYTKRPDILLFVNGLPLVVIELKNPTDQNADVQSAFRQLQTYQATIPSLFTYNEICVISDGLDARVGSHTADSSRYLPWKSADGKAEASHLVPQLEILIKGMLNPRTLLDLVRNFIVFESARREDPKTKLLQVVKAKKLAAYHQYYAVNKAVETTLAAARTNDKNLKGKGGVVWHTQGSGKSLSMVFYAGKIVQALDNPTVVVITDRNDLDDQLFKTFAASSQLLRQPPKQAENRGQLKELLRVNAGGIVFTTIQKFLPEGDRAVFDQLSDRRNVVVIADEAHRTQYGFEAKFLSERDKSGNIIGQRIAYGFAKYMRDALPNATYIGFTGTPIESTDVNTAAVFGQYVDIYDIKKAVEDKATVRIYYESRLAKVKLDEEVRDQLDQLEQELEDIEELSEKQKANQKWSRFEAIVGHPERIRNLAEDIVSHFEKRELALVGKGMIVAMSRRIAAALYEAIIELRPDWHSADLHKGAIKVVMTTSSSDGPELAKHNTSKVERRVLADRVKDPNDILKLVIVCDMWLTGFDAPCLHTLYVDKLMQGHNLMQAIARVNRVFQEKPGGLVVDYIGIAANLKKALAFYADAGGEGNPTELQAKAVDVMLEKYEVVQQLFNGFDYKSYFRAQTAEKLGIILQAEDHVLGLPEGKDRFVREVLSLSKSFALSLPTEEAMNIKDDVAFFQAIKARLVKFTQNNTQSTVADYESAIRQIVDSAIVSDKVIDIFDAAGIKKPDISIFSDDFLDEIKGMKHKNLALELLKKLLNDEIRARMRTNLVQSRKFSEMLEDAIRRYQNNLLTTAEIIQELIDMAKDIKEADRRGEELGLSTDEMAFYDALEVNDSAVRIMGDDKLREIARELADKIRTNTSIDWTIKESARSKLMVLVRRTLTKFGYPPDKQEQAVQTVLEQAKRMADSVVEG